MRLTAKGRGFLVYDEVLNQEAFENLWLYMQRCTYGWVHAQGWMKAWRLSDGMAFAGPVSYSDGEIARQLNGPQWNAPPDCIYPTGHHIDSLIQVIAQHHAQWAPLIGERGSDWLGFTAKPFLYPEGAGLSWHEDAYHYSGAFTYYAHPEWNVKWGGELLFGGAGQGENSSIYRHDRSERPGQHLDNSVENARLMDPGLGQFVFARPNRLVVVQTGVPHAVNPVTRAAGDRVRASVAGFFVAPRASS